MLDVDLRNFLNHVAFDVLPAEYKHQNYAPEGISEAAEALLERIPMTMKTDPPSTFHVSPTTHLTPTESEPEAPAKTGKKRKLSRPTTPELESLYFQTVLHQTKRETALLMWVMGRTNDGGKALAEMFLNPQPTE